MSNGARRLIPRKTCMCTPADSLCSFSLLCSNNVGNIQLHWVKSKSNSWSIRWHKEFKSPEFVNVPWSTLSIYIHTHISTLKDDSKNFHRSSTDKQLHQQTSELKKAAITNLPKKKKLPPKWKPDSNQSTNIWNWILYKPQSYYFTNETKQAQS